MDQLNQTLLALSAENQTAINQLIKTQTSQKEAFTTIAEAKEKRAYDLDFISIPVFNGRNKAKFHGSGGYNTHAHTVIGTYTKNT